MTNTRKVWETYSSATDLVLKCDKRKEGSVCFCVPGGRGRWTKHDNYGSLSKSARSMKILGNILNIVNNVAVICL